MPIAQTTRETYRKIRPDLARRRSRVLSIIRDWPGPLGPTIADIAQKIGVPDNQISGRVTELLATGHIRINGRKLNKTGKTARTYATPKTPTQLTLFQNN